MMKFMHRVVNILFVILIASPASAYSVTDIKTFDRILKQGEEIHWLFDLASYGFVAGRDKLVGSPILTLELRDLKPGSLDEPPFISLFIDQGRSYHQVNDDQDWVVDGMPSFNRFGHMIPYLKVDVDDVWLGDVTLTFDFTPGPTKIPEPAPLALIGLGLLATGLRQRNALRIMGFK